MNKGEVVKTDVVIGNAKEPASLLVEEIQVDSFSDKKDTIRGRRVLKNGEIGSQMLCVTVDHVIS